MLIAPIIFLIAASLGFLFWLFRRRARSRADEKRSRQQPGAPGVAEVRAAALDAERSSERPPNDEPLEKRAEKFAGKTKAPEKKVQIEASPADEFLRSQGNGSLLSSDATGTRTAAGGGAPSREEFIRAKPAPVISLPASSIEILPKHEQQVEEASVTGFKGEYSAEGPIAPAVTAPLTVGDQVQSGTTLRQTAVAEAVQSVSEGLTTAGAVAEQGQLSQEMPPVEPDSAKGPQRYRPPPQKLPRQTGARLVNQQPKKAALSEVSLGIRVRLTFDRFGVCELGLLPERTSELDNEVAVKFGGMSLLLVAQEDWYEDLHLRNIGGHLREGVELKAVLGDQREARWLLTGRDLYVLASHPRASGFVSTNRLALGRSHVVLCGAGLLQHVEAILNEAGCEGYTKLAESDGVPSGWVGLRGVSPTKEVALDLGSDPFYAIKPAPDIEINLEGGVCLRGSVWLCGYPPRIKLFGESIRAVKVLIDGKEAQRTTDGLLIVDGYDVCGQHSVYCEGLSCSRSYSIEEAPDSWQTWPAYHFGQTDICGPLVQLAPEASGGRAVIVPMSNPVLLGAEPGEVFNCSRRSVAHWKGFVPFDVVWALPAQPLRCDKKTARILQFADAPVAPTKTRTKPVLEWSTAILDASRKGLRVENGLPGAGARWRDYKKVARNIWRATR